jgi:ISXO2-like transposase domain
VRETISHKVSLLCTDQLAGYKQLDCEYPHRVIDHSKGQYVVGAIYTQTIEGFWSIFNRGVVGTFHKMSRKYMPLYVAESNSATITGKTRTSSERRLRGFRGLNRNIGFALNDPINSHFWLSLFVLALKNIEL